ncbi:DUF190 domain-containing protein [Mycolicibacterium smegmatis]|uniref:DUF190 domain-containing protein n=1 Tax=Mycolicibacterium smegmatis (strain MKD8) TaxID=1214915 RepID=A0A2U9PN84_MYCSE|nr:DUF190 domain-containing protein [Mycolicibacterium smegmatis]AWT53095.1 hypothetical protein D806_021130 [Mycolicibacterium smegmatis MKD8]MCP2622758.1 DUF190 domain-containing protein [Mycolicibacterium smegmatis]MDF1903401.1 DUF190 domain-containing protein [Mycolicibacterium smegmatis]MDF1909900.1 DUF190 domain-containing protein [Mycolicibacterium smegmatis]MDF1919122.1 DUF190 domain-containing protein [Mycolicibacterium smegmatis]
MTTADYLKLTGYFGERQRHGDRFAADALFDLYGDAGVATSVMLRGAAGFGPSRQIRTDETLTMSEDPAVAVAAVDTAATIAALAEQAVEMVPRGLITLERAQLVTAATPAPTIPSTSKLTIYVGRHHRVAGAPAHRAVIALLHRLGFAAATVFVGVDGTFHGQRRRARFFSPNTHVPVMIIAVGSGEQVGAALGELTALLDRPLMTVERAEVCKRDGKLIGKPAALPATDTQGRAIWQKLMIHTAGAALHDGVPVHRALVRRLLGSGAAGGATVVRGVWGFCGDGELHGDSLFQVARYVPVTTVVVDTPERIAAGFEIVDEVTAGHGVVTAEMVPAAVTIDGPHRSGSTALAYHSY